MEHVNTAPTESRPHQKERFWDSLEVPPRVLAAAAAVLLAVGGYAVRHSLIGRAGRGRAARDAHLSGRPPARHP